MVYHRWIYFLKLKSQKANKISEKESKFLEELTKETKEDFDNFYCELTIIPSILYFDFRT